MKKILIVAYHFPPVKISSAVQRILKFSKYLEQDNWQSIILSIRPNAAIATSNEQINEIPASTFVKRSFALDTHRHLSFRGRYLSWMALPDRWSSWIPFAVFDGIRLIKKQKPELILSTYPIASAHIIGFFLHKITHLPWIADFRDSMTDDVFPASPSTKKIYQWLENKIIRNCTIAIFTSQGTVNMYAKRYPDLPFSHWALIPNGYDEENFLHAEKVMPFKEKSHKPIKLLHSGVIYPLERDPTPLFSAIALLKERAQISANTLSIVLRATNHDNFLQSLIDETDIGDIVSIQPTIPYQDALAEMLASDGLLILQASNCNHQIPAKVYEYMRSQRPILALTDPHGDTARLLLDEGIKSIIPLDDKNKIADGLLLFMENIKSGELNIPAISHINKYSRKACTKELAIILNELVTTQ